MTASISNFNAVRNDDIAGTNAGADADSSDEAAIDCLNFLLRAVKVRDQADRFSDQGASCRRWPQYTPDAIEQNDMQIGRQLPQKPRGGGLGQIDLACGRT